MTPGARVAAAIEVLDDINEGLAAEQALTRWARRSRFAGSKDRAAIRDHVFDVLRCRPMAAHYGQGDDGRALMIGLLHHMGQDATTLFTGEGHAPAPLSEAEATPPAAPTDRATLWCLPDWLLPEFDRSLGDDAEGIAMELQRRAPVGLRVNTARTTPAAAQEALAAEGVETTPNPLADTALTITEGPRKLRNSQSYQTGLVELQDPASQAVVAALPPGGRVLDYCAGGGGKALALAADKTRQVWAHDIDPKRMGDLGPRAERAEAVVTQLPTDELSDEAPFDIVLCDAPCSGSGAWRRAAEGKWTLTPERLDALTGIQDDILDAAAELVAPKGVLAYATCSIFTAENEARVAAFLDRNAGWRCDFQRRFAVNADGDGFFTAHLTRV